MRMRFQRVFTTGAAIFWLALLTSAQAQPAIALPLPTGPYAVGRMTYHWTDPDRDETFTDEPRDKREIAVTLFYPAAVGDTQPPAPYIEGKLQAALSELLGVPEQAWSAIQTHEYAEAPLAEAEPRYPVLLFSPGFGALSRFYSATLTELASQGYIVAAMSHPYSDPAALLAGDRVVLANQAGDVLGGRTREEVDERSRRVGEVWAADMRFALDQLEVLDRTDSVFAGRLDLERVGAFGHSFGGAAAASAAYADRRIKAVLDMDGTLFGEVAQKGISQPFMLMLSQGAYDQISQAPSDAELAHIGMSREEYDQSSDRAVYLRSLERAAAGYLFMLEGAQHMTYTTDFLVFAPFFPDLLDTQTIGALDAERAIHIIDTYASAFFDRHLRGRAMPLLDGNSREYPEVLLERH